MRRITLLFVFLTISVIVLGQSLDLMLPSLIKIAKKRSLPVLARDSTFPDNEYILGTGVFIGDIYNRGMILTCEHVIAKKDSNKKTIGYLTEIFVRMNGKDDSVRNVRMRAKYVDEENDFALLAIIDTPANVKLMDEMEFEVMPLNSCLTTVKIHEGDPILYIGYPMKFGVDNINHPLSRTGIVAQLVPGTDFFLIDGFVQHGHSGSPVFKIEYDGHDSIWWLRLIGITTSYPPEFGKLLQKVNYDEVIGVKTDLNPGFTFVTSMNQIIPILSDSLKMK